MTNEIRPLRLTRQRAAHLAAGADVLLDMGTIDVPTYERLASCSRTRLYWPAEASTVAMALESYDDARKVSGMGTTWLTPGWIATHAERLDDAERAYRCACRALVTATRDEVAAEGREREHLSLVVEVLAGEARERWRRVLAIAAEPG